jgi:hypothetical protein
VALLDSADVPDDPVRLPRVLRVMERAKQAEGGGRRLWRSITRLQTWIMLVALRDSKLRARRAMDFEAPGRCRGLLVKRFVTAVLSGADRRCAEAGVRKMREVRGQLPDTVCCFDYSNGGMETLAVVIARSRPYSTVHGAIQLVGSDERTAGFYGGCLASESLLDEDYAARQRPIRRFVEERHRDLEEWLVAIDAHLTRRAACAAGSLAGPEFGEVRGKMLALLLMEDEHRSAVKRAARAARIDGASAAAGVAGASDGEGSDSTDGAPAQPERPGKAGAAARRSRSGAGGAGAAAGAQIPADGGRGVNRAGRGRVDGARAVVPVLHMRRGPRNGVGRALAGAAGDAGARRGSAGGEEGGGPYVSYAINVVWPPVVAGVLHLYVANNLRRALLGARLDADEKRLVPSGGSAGAPPSKSSRHAVNPPRAPPALPLACALR